MSKIIAFSGKKQSGKNTMANYLAGEILVQKGVISKYAISDKGELLVPAQTSYGVVMGNLDLLRQDSSFVDYASKLVWPHVKLYSFAEPIKEICMDLFDFTFEDVYGTDAQKDSKSKLKWENMPNYMEMKISNKSKAPKGFMTNREVMQHIGTEIFGRMYPDVWAKHLIKRVRRDSPSVAMICDCRFHNEVAVIQDAGGKVVRLTRKVYDDKHLSETSLDKDVFDWSKFDLIVDNENQTKFQTYQAIKPKLIEWGILA
jgi:hypothetical protein